MKIPLPLILASASPRRRKILAGLGFTFRVVVPDVDEVHWDTDPEGSVRENAIRKCSAVGAQFPEAVVLAADTVVAFEGLSIGKPKTVTSAKAMLLKFSGRDQRVYTGVAMQRPDLEIQEQVVTSVVHFRALTDAAVSQYLERVDPLDKAGGYDIDQHRELIIRGYEGSRTNIMGLPQELVKAWLA